MVAFEYQPPTSRPECEMRESGGKCDKENLGGKELPSENPHGNRGAV